MDGLCEASSRSSTDRDSCYVFDDAAMCVNGRSYKPTQEHLAVEILAQLRHLVIDEGDWVFVDLGCGQGKMLLTVQNANVFSEVIGIELDVETYEQAHELVGPVPRVQVVCGDMFAYPEQMHADGTTDRVVFYMYEPLWRAEMPAAERDALYDGLLAQLSTMNNCAVVYCAVEESIKKRHIASSAFVSHGFCLLSEFSMANSGLYDALNFGTDLIQIWGVNLATMQPSSVVPLQTCTSNDTHKRHTSCYEVATLPANIWSPTNEWFARTQAEIYDNSKMDIF